MVRIILGVITGFIVWSIVWVGGDSVLATYVSPDWIGKYAVDMEKAFINGTPFTPIPAIAAIYLVRSFVTSIIAGYMAALVAGEYKRSTMILGIMLFVVGVVVEYLFRNMAPIWYHILFILFLIPMTILGGKLRRSN